MSAFEMTDAGRAYSARLELRTLLNLYPDAAPGLEERIKAGKINPSDYMFQGCGCIYGSLVAESQPEYSEGEIQNEAPRLRRSTYGLGLSPLEVFVCDLPLHEDPYSVPPFYTLDDPIASALLRWVQEWREERAAR